MKIHFISIIFVSSLLLCATGCGVSFSPQKITNKDTLSVVASFYPVAYITERIGGTYVDVNTIIQAGVEPHDYEPTTQDAVALSNADVVVYNGLGVDDWMKTSAAEVESQARILALSEPTDAWVRVAQDTQASDEIYDPHTWLSITIVEQQVSRVVETLSAVDPVHATAYTENARVFIQELEVLNAEIIREIGQQSSCRLHTFVTAHDAFRYFAQDYDLQMIAVTGISPEQEPSAATIADVITIIQKEQVPVVFFETLSSPVIAQTIANETGATTGILNPIEGLTTEDIAAGKEYMDLMRDNKNALMKALQCN